MNLKYWFYCFLATESAGINEFSIMVGLVDTDPGWTLAIAIV